MLKWGILGAGNISGQFAHDIILSNKNNDKTHAIVAVGTSLVPKGEDFLTQYEVTAGNNHGIRAVSQNYEDFYANPDVDVVYIGTPHSFHKDQILSALKHGKHVLCEKPFTVTGAEAAEVFEYAKKLGLFVMEAVWTRFFPIISHVREILYEKKLIGDVFRLRADFAFNFDLPNTPESSRARDISLAAGATLDIGVYTLTYSRILMNQPAGAKFDVKSFLTLDPKDKVDHLATYIVKYEDGKQAVLSCSNLVNGPTPFLRIDGTEGSLEIYAINPAQPRRLRVVFRDEKKAPFEIEDDIIESGHHGFIYEANAVAEAIKAGKQQSDVIPWDETQFMMDTMDKIRWENDFYYSEDDKNALLKKV